MRNILHIVRDLHHGGIQKKLYHFIRDTADQDIKHHVVSMDVNDDIAEDFRDLPNADITVLKIPNSPISLAGTTRWAKALIGVARSISQIDIVHSWSSTTHRLVIPLKLFGPASKGTVISYDSIDVLEPYKEAPLGLKISHFTLGRFLPTQNSRIVTLSPEMRKGLLSCGYPDHLIKVVMNGIDTEYFKPVEGYDIALKQELLLPENSYVIGMASRHTAMGNGYGKDVKGFVHAAAALRDKCADLFERTHFVLCGKGTNEGDISRLAVGLGLGDRFRILGPRNDMVRQYNGYDLSNMCSIREPFGLVAGESMACKTPCVVTDTDLLPQIVGDSNFVVPVGDASVRADSWERFLKLPNTAKRAFSNAAREHIVRNFSHKKMIDEYMGVYDDLINIRKPSSP